MGTAHPLLSSSFGPSLFMLGSWNTDLGHSVVVGQVLEALVIVTLQGLGKDVVSDTKLLFFSTYDVWGQALQPIPHSSLVVIA